MATNLVNPGATAIQPDPILTNLMQSCAAQGDWFAPVACSVKQVAKDFVRWGKQDNQNLLSNLYETLRAPGSRYNLVPRGVLSWATSVIREDAVRVEYTEEDVSNAISPEEPRANAAMKVLNVLQFATEQRVATLMATASQTAGASAAWAGAAGSIQADIESAKLAILKNCGLPANYIEIAPSKAPGAFASTELKSLRVYTEANLIGQTGFVPTLFGLRVFVPGTRIDSLPTGAFTPAFVWDDATAYVGYSPTLDGGAWSGDGQAFAVQFENQLNGSAFEARERLDPNFEENLIHIVYGNVRRSLPEIFNDNVVFKITGI